MSLPFPPPEYVNYTFPFVALFLLLLTYYLKGYYILASNIFVIGIYTILVPTVFFTYGAYVEKKVAKDELSRFIESEFGFLHSILNNSSPASIANTGDTGDTDDETEKLNKEIIKYSLIICGSICLLFLFFTFLIWKYGSKYNYKKMAYKNGLLILLVVSTEIIFATLILGKYRNLNYNETKSEFYKQLYEYGTSSP